MGRVELKKVDLWETQLMRKLIDEKDDWWEILLGIMNRWTDKWTNWQMDKWTNELTMLILELPRNWKGQKRNHTSNIDNFQKGKFKMHVWHLAIIRYNTFGLKNFDRVEWLLCKNENKTYHILFCPQSSKFLGNAKSLQTVSSAKKK